MSNLTRIITTFCPRLISLMSYRANEWNKYTNDQNRFDSCVKFCLSSYFAYQEYIPQKALFALNGIQLLNTLQNKCKIHIESPVSKFHETKFGGFMFLSESTDNKIQSYKD